MSKQFSFTLKDAPGSLVQVAEALGDAGVNIDAILGVSHGNEATVQVLTNHEENTIEALNEANISYKKQDIIIVKLKDAPGQVAKFSRALADAGVNIHSFYLTLDGKEVIAAEPLEKAKSVAREFGVLIS